MWRETRRIVVPAVLGLLVGGCDGLSDVGEQEQTPPFAVITPLNQPFTTDAGSKVTLTVRSGAEVFLSGKESDGTVVPVIRYEWSELNAPAQDLRAKFQIVDRNNNTISFTAPAVSSDTTLDFRLTVIDSNGNTDQADASVTVRPIPDPNRFLSYDLDAAGTFVVTAVTDRLVAGDELLSDAPFTITLERRVSYFDFDGNRRENVSLDTRQIHGGWLAGYGASPDCDDPHNPRFSASVPALDMDDVTARVQSTDPRRAMDPARIDEAELTLRISISLDAGGGLPANALPGTCVDDSAGSVVLGSAKPDVGAALLAADGVSGERIVGLEQLLGAPTTTLDTQTSAAAYYRTIDDAVSYAQKATFSGWLKATGFLPQDATRIDWEDLAALASTGAHAIYTNNFDLGFGRDMYMRVVACDDGQLPALGQAIDPAKIGQCDIAGVVVNYASLEAAAKKLGPIVAVAMEYSSGPHTSGERITKFYTFAPNRRTGDYDRVLSVNLDGRGEKYMPGVCTVCHGGTPAGLDPAATGADGQPLYGNGGDVDAGFLSWDLDSFLFADTDQGFTGNPGDASLRDLYTRSSQEAAMRRLNQLAYLTFADPAAAPGRFALARELVEGWYGGPGLPDATFFGAFVPAGWDPAQTPDSPADADDVYLDVFAQNCRACHVLQVPGSGVDNQLAVGSYRDLFDNAKLLDLFTAGRMPFARHTMDRFWIGTGAGSVPADALANHLAALEPPLVLEPPGQPQACFSGLASALVPGEAERLDASCSRFASSLSWTLEKPAGSDAVLAFADSSAPVYPVLLGVDSKGTYTVTLNVPGAEPFALSQDRVNSVPVPPVIDPISIAPGETLDVDILGQTTGGDGDLVLSQAASSDPTIASVMQIDGSIRITGEQLSGTEVTVSYLIAELDPEDSVAGQFNVKVTANLTANPVTATAAMRRTGTSLAAVPATSINLAASVVGAAGAPLSFRTYEATPGQQLIGRDGAKGQITVDGATGIVSYKPPAGRMTRFVRTGGATVALDASDRFQYEVCYVNDPSICANNTVTVTIEGREDQQNILFSGLHTSNSNAFNASATADCAGCHGNAGYPPWLNLGSAKATYCALVQGSDGGLNRDPNVYGYDSGRAFVIRGAPGTSAIYLKGQGKLGHEQPVDFVPAPGSDDSTVNGSVEGTTTLHQLILNWIAEGAYFTDASDQSCP